SAGRTLLLRAATGRRTIPFEHGQQVVRGSRRPTGRETEVLDRLARESVDADHVVLVSTEHDEIPVSGLTEHDGDVSMLSTLVGEDANRADRGRTGVVAPMEVVLRPAALRPLEARQIELGIEERGTPWTVVVITLWRLLRRVMPALDERRSVRAGLLVHADES